MDKSTAVHEKADAYGIDISLIRANLRLTPIQRLRRHDQALATTKRLQAAMGRPKDIETIRQLETILSERIESSSQKS